MASISRRCGLLTPCSSDSWEKVGTSVCSLTDKILDTDGGPSDGADDGPGDGADATMLGIHAFDCVGDGPGDGAGDSPSDALPLPKGTPWLPYDDNGDNLAFESWPLNNSPPALCKPATHRIRHRRIYECAHLLGAYQGATT